LPQINATLDKLRGAKYLTTLDLQQGYWQILLASESRAVTAFTVPGQGLMQFKVMLFELHSAPATFQRSLDTILGPELEPHVFIYLDDIIIVSATFEKYLRHLAEVFRRLLDARLRLNPEKCHFCRIKIPRTYSGLQGHSHRSGESEDYDTVAPVVDRPSDQPIRARVVVPLFYHRILDHRRTIDQAHEKERPLAMRGEGGTGFPDTQQVFRVFPDPRMPRL